MEGRGEAEEDKKTKTDPLFPYGRHWVKEETDKGEGIVVRSG
jgi:hypothetical protein